ncbi:MAG: hypothetical protein BWY72_01936 [Bacteroidetes bacterium ADurb.Bin416]|nr:MAG: hypothetical protein BWY72_01936 [Bacteroidetes bacterium ADurb.Bin416]
MVGFHKKNVLKKTHHGRKMFINGVYLYPRALFSTYFVSSTKVETYLNQYPFFI